MEKASSGAEAMADVDGDRSKDGVEDAAEQDGAVCESRASLRRKGGLKPNGLQLALLGQKLLQCVGRVSVPAGMEVVEGVSLIYITQILPFNSGSS